MKKFRKAILEVLPRIGAKTLPGGFWMNEQGKLIESYEEDDAQWLGAKPCPMENSWLDEQGNPLTNYIQEDGMEERGCGTQSEKHKDTVSAGDVRNTAQRGGA